jgi:hypothetical protein
MRPRLPQSSYSTVLPSIDLKVKDLAQSSIKSRYEPVKRMLEKHLNIQAAAVDKRRAVKFADVCAGTLTPGTAKARIMLLKSAWEWGRGRYQLADENPVGVKYRKRYTTKKTAITLSLKHNLLRTFLHFLYFMYNQEI